jgi:hypothetical protein
MISNTWQAMAQQGDVAAVQHVQEIGGTAMFARLTGFQQALTNMQMMIQKISQDPNSSPSDKRQTIDKIYGEMSATARSGNELMWATATAH